MILTAVLSFLLLYKYTALFLATFLAAFIFPLPITAIIMAAGAFAAQGYFNFSDIIFVGLIGNVLGDGLGYFVSYRYGKDFLNRIGFRRTLNSQKFTQLENYYSKHALYSIFFTRFLITGLGATVNVLSGFSKIPYKKFLWVDCLGQLIYMVMFAGLGYIMGDEWRNLINIIEEAAVILLLLALIIFIIVVVLKKRHHKHEVS